MPSGQIKTTLSHIFSLTIVAGSSLYFVGKDLEGDYTEWLFLAWKFFWGVFASGAIILGMAGAFHSSLFITKKLLSDADFNTKEIRYEVAMLIYYAGEIGFSLVVLFLSGFISYGFYPISTDG